MASLVVATMVEQDAVSAEIKTIRAFCILIMFKANRIVIFKKNKVKHFYIAYRTHAYGGKIIPLLPLIQHNIP
jgi:hypothetical protein